MPRTTKRRLFGTDGIRGVANVEPMTPETILHLGRAAGTYFRTAGERRHRVVIGKDTRLSGYMFEQALASGLASTGVDSILVGPMPTPGIAFLTRSLRADAGIVISASHNPFQDNGIKFFGPDGFKLPDSAEAEIEALLERPAGHDSVEGPAVGKARSLDDAGGRYNAYLKSTIPRSMTLDGMKIALDCSHGAAHRIGPAVFDELGAEVTTIGTSPNGTNINDGIGAVHPEKLQAMVKETGADVGIALDGDADRAMLIDEAGEVVDGDHIMAILAVQMKEQGRLKGPTLVGTVMSNFGLEAAMRERGIELVRTDVGDRYVVEHMRRHDLNLGGEQSGHIVSLEHSTTGDGMLTALAVLAVLRESGRPLTELKKILKSYPQRLVNRRVKEKRDLGTIPAVVEAIARAEAAMAGSGRVLVRYSGTEALARVMIEGEQQDAVDEHANAIADAIVAELG